MGFGVHAFVDPVQALDHINTDDCKYCKIVVSDVRMPVMSGLELVMLIKRKRPEMKIVLMTAFEIDKNELQKIIPTVNIDGFVRKPFRSALLIETVKQACSVPTA